MDYLNLRYYNDATVQVPPAIHYRVTIEFWTFIHNPLIIGNNVANLVYNDFITVSLSTSANTNDVDVFCTPLQFIYQLTGVKTLTGAGSLNTSNINTTPSPAKDFFVFVTQTAVKDTWFYTRCAFSIELGKMFINTNAEVNLPIPQQFATQINYNTYIKKFYAATDTVGFTLRGWGGAGGLTVDNYIRNINVYKEYIPANFNYPNYL